ncbi:MAG: hypothetical protein J5646_08745 [Bacteroidales bacterium]|nr:hypothetical protein [Bacteroidales bacterium]
MKKAFIRLLCLLLGLNVFTACYGPGPIPPDNLKEDVETKALLEEEDQEAEPQPETEDEQQLP